MRWIEARLYDAFSERVFGGNRAGVIIDRKGLEESEMQSVASELAAPATCFVVNQGNRFEARFFTPVQELVMCGHGIVAIFTALASEAELDESNIPPTTVELDTVSGKVAVDVFPTRERVD